MFVLSVTTHTFVIACVSDPLCSLVSCLTLTVLVFGAGAEATWGQVPQRVITAKATSAMSVYASDLNGDGAVDVLFASLANDKVAWHENEMNEAGADSDGFGPERVITTDAELARSVAATDVDGDGDADVLSASSYDDRVAWYENRTGEAEVDADGFGPQQTITTSADGAQSVSTADLDGDGDADVLVASANDDKVAWYENRLGEPTADGDGFGAERVITTEAELAYCVSTADLDGDGDEDVLSASSFDSKVAWYENQLGEPAADGDGFGSPRPIATDADGAVSVRAADLDGDGDKDVLSASSYDDQIAWYENQLGEEDASADGFGGNRTITTNADYAASVFAADLDGDGDADVLSASRADDEIAWYENQTQQSAADSDGFGGQKTITTDADEAQSVYAADLTGDGRPDVLSASTNDDKVAWYPNSDRALPVELVAFDGRLADKGTVELVWRTASETRNAGFAVERTGGLDQDWEEIGFVESKAPGGISSRPTSYRFTDADLPYAADSLAYRLRQVAKDGPVSYSSELVVSRALEGAALLAPAPNPARNRVKVRFVIPRRQEVTLSLYDELGRRIRVVVDGSREGRCETGLDVSALSSGTYFLRLRAEAGVRTRPLVVVR